MATAQLARVLVIDDMPQVRQLFGRYLTVAGIEACFAADGIEGLAAVRRSPPDLVLCDLEMPRMDGVQLCLALRGDPATQRLPIVAITGSGGPASRAALAAGCDVVLPKPCSRALLMVTIRELLAVAEAARGVAAQSARPEPGDA